MSVDDLLQRETTHHVIGAFFEVSKTLGFGFLEHVYREALERELVERGGIVMKEVLVPIWYKGAVISGSGSLLLSARSPSWEVAKVCNLFPTRARRRCCPVAQ